MVSRSGFTLLEVMVALLVVTVALAGLAGALGPITALAGRGRLDARMASAMESRIDDLGRELGAGGPACRPPGSGSATHPDGVTEQWTVSARPGLVEVEITARAPGRSGADSVVLVTRIPCP